MEYKVAWGIAFDLDFCKLEIWRICQENGVPYPKRLIITKFSDRFIVGYTYLPVIHPEDAANVQVINKWCPTWFSERLK